MNLNDLRQNLRGRTDALMRAVLKNSGWAVAGQAANAVASLIETFLLLRALQSESRAGVYWLIFSVSEAVFGVLDFRTGEAVIKYLPEFRLKKGLPGVAALLRLAFTVDAVVALAGFLFIVLLSGVIMKVARVPGTDEYVASLLVVAAGGAFRTAVRSVGAYMRVSGAFDTAIKLGVAAAACRVTLLVIVAFTFRSVLGFSVASGLADLILFGILMGGAIMALRALNANPLAVRYGELNAGERRQVLSFLVSTNLAGTLRTLSTKLDVVVIAWLSSPGTVAIYKTASRLASTLMLFSDPLILAVYPELSKLHAEGRKREARRLVWTLTKVMAAIAVAVVLIFAAVGKWGFEAAGLAKYAQAHTVAMYMFAGTSVSMILFWARPVLLAYGKAANLAGATFVAVAVQFVALYLLVPPLQAEGSGMALALSYIANIGAFLALLYYRTDFLKREATPTTDQKS